VAKIFLSTLTTKSAQEYNNSVLDILCMTYYVTSSLAVFEAAIGVKSMYTITSSLQTRKKIWKLKKFYINLHLKDHSQVEFTAC